MNLVISQMNWPTIGDEIETTSTLINYFVSFTIGCNSLNCTSLEVDGRTYNKGFQVKICLIPILRATIQMIQYEWNSTRNKNFQPDEQIESIWREPVLQIQSNHDAKYGYILAHI